MAEGSAAPAPAPGDGICVSSSWERKPAGSERGGFVTAGHRGVPPALTHPNVLFGRDSSPFSLKTPFLTLFPSFPTPWGRNSLFRPLWRRLFRVLGFLAKVWCVPAGGRCCRREMQVNKTRIGQTLKGALVGVTPQKRSLDFLFGASRSAPSTAPQQCSSRGVSRLFLRN